MKTCREHLETFIIYSMKDLSIYNDSNTPNPLSPLSLPDLEKHVLTGDGLREYPTIAAKANIDFHRCVFHLLMGQRIPVWKRQAIILRKIVANNLKESWRKLFKLLNLVNYALKLLNLIKTIKII